LPASITYAPPGRITTAEPFACPCCGSKTVSVGVSSQALPLASGASPGHRRIVWMPRKSLLLPAAAQGNFCPCASPQAINPIPSIAKTRFIGNLLSLNFSD